MQLHSHVIAATSAEKLILIYSRIQAPRCPGVISPGSGNLTCCCHCCRCWAKDWLSRCPILNWKKTCSTRTVSLGTISFQWMSLIENTKASRCFTIPKHFLQHSGPVLFSYVTKISLFFHIYQEITDCVQSHIVSINTGHGREDWSKGILWLSTCPLSTATGPMSKSRNDCPCASSVHSKEMVVHMFILKPVWLISNFQPSIHLHVTYYLIPPLCNSRGTEGKCRWGRGWSRQGHLVQGGSIY